MQCTKLCFFIEKKVLKASGIMPAQKYASGAEPNLGDPDTPLPNVMAPANAASHRVVV
jgi:hypothetical protein